MSSRLKKKVLVTWLLMFGFGCVLVLTGSGSWENRTFLLLFLIPPTAVAALSIHMFEILEAWSLSRQRKGLVPYVRPLVDADISANLSEVADALKQIVEAHPQVKKFEINGPDRFVFTTRFNWRSFGERVILALESRGTRSTQLAGASLPVKGNTLFDGGRNFSLLSGLIAEVESRFPGKVSVGNYRHFADPSDPRI